MRFRLLFTGILLCSGFLRAQELTWDAVDDSLFLVYRFEQITVYGKQINPSPSMITEVSEQEIQRRGGTSVADVLRSDPGLTITSGSKAETETRIRGFQPNGVLVLVDGRPINPGYYGKADLSMISKDAIAKIKVIKGPASVAYGPNQMGGVINIITRNGFEGSRTSIQTELGNHRYRKISLNQSGIKGKWNYWLSGYEHHSKGFELSQDFQATSIEDGGIRENASYQKFGGALKIGFQPSKKSTYALSMGYHWAKKDCPWSVYEFEEPQYRRFPEWKRFGTAFSGNWNLSPRIQMKSIVFLDGYHDRFQSFKTREMSKDQLEYDSLLENWTIGASTDVTIQSISGHQIQTGFHVRRDLMNKKPDLDEAWFSNSFVTGTVYAEDRYHLTKTTLLTAGLSGHVFWKVETKDYQIHGCPMISLNQRLPKQIQFRISFAQAIQFPTMHQLYSESSGNPDLKPEWADKFEVGLTHTFFLPHFSGVALSMEGVYFYNDLNHLIYRASRTYRFENISTARLQGWEARMSLQKDNTFGVNSGFAKMFGDHSTKELMEEVPEFEGRIDFWCQLSWGTELRYEYRLYGQRSTYTSSWILTGYQAHDFFVSQTIASGLSFQFRLNNLFDENYQEELGYPSPGRQITFGISWHRHSNWSN